LQGDSERLRVVAEQHGQGHVFRWWHELDGTWRAYLLEQLGSLDFAELDRLIETLVRNPRAGDIGELRPAEPIALPATEEGVAERRRAVGIGEDAIRAGHVAVLVVAGGLGTRLRYIPPKGTYPAAPITGKTLFQLHAEKILAARRRYGVTIPWYIMTSEATDAPTRAFLAEHGCFGLGAENVVFFEQPLSPAVDFHGRLLLAEKGALAMSPNGHGGIVEALGKGGVLADMRRRGIRIISYFQVDNPLIKLLDPLFLGLHVERGSDFSSKALLKRDAEEGLGVFCYAGDRFNVVEYSHLPAHYKYAADQLGRLVFLAGSIAIHAVNVEFFESLVAQGVVLRYHRANKKIKCVDKSGQVIEPEKNNGVRFEKFVFDALPYARSPLVLLVDRAEEFAPIKNKEGKDSPATARRAMINLAASWLQKAGVTVPRDAKGDSVARIEIGPLYALDEDELRGRLPPGIELTRDLNLQGS